MKIIFEYLRPDVWQYKIARILKEKEIKTVSISPLSLDKKFSEAFDEVITLNLENLKPKTILKTIIKNPLTFFKTFYKIMAIKADAIICQGAPHYLTAFFIWFYSGRFPRIYFPYDIANSMYHNLKKYLPRREIWGEKYSFKNCDAIIYKNALEELDCLPPIFKVKEKPILGFEPYPFAKWFVPYTLEKKLSYTDKQIHIVYVGSFLDVPALSMSSDAAEILKQKIHMHIYPRDPLTSDQIFKITQDRKELKKYLHLHNFVAPEKLSEEISKYDFGLFFFHYTNKIISKAAKYTFGNKRASYFEALIPVITHNDAEYINKEVTKNNLGIVLNDIKDLKKGIHVFDYKKSVKNIEKFREKDNIENNIPRLIKFIKDLKK